jgi:hypothetical protein
MTESFPSRHFSIGLPLDAPDQSLTAMFRHVSDYLAEDAPISMDDVLAVTFWTELCDDGVSRGAFTIILNDDSPETSMAV